MKDSQCVLLCTDWNSKGGVKSVSCVPVSKERTHAVDAVAARTGVIRCERTYRLFALAFLCFTVGAVLLLGRFTRRSVFMPPAADVLE